MAVASLKWVVGSYSSYGDSHGKPEGQNERENRPSRQRRQEERERSRPQKRPKNAGIRQEAGKERAVSSKVPHQHGPTRLARALTRTLACSSVYFPLVTSL